jgi:ketosteroid isomerase-like protein
VRTVPRENLETALRAIDAFNADDLDRFLDECDPQVEVHSRFTEVGGVYRGHVGLKRWHQDLSDRWEYLRLELERLIDVDDHTVLALMTMYGKGRGSGIEVSQPIAHLDTVRAGKLSRIVTYTNRNEALKAAGLPE